MNITTIEIPLYYLDVVVIIDDWEQANKKFKLDIKESEYNADALTIEDDNTSLNEVYLLLKSNYLDYWTIIHELMHLVSAICKLKGIKMDPKNDEPLAYMQAFLGQEILKFRDKHLQAIKK